MTVYDENYDTTESAIPTAATLAVPTQPLLYTIDEAAAILRISRTWLRNEAKAGFVQHTVLGRTTLFSLDDMYAIIADRCSPARSVA